MTESKIDKYVLLDGGTVITMNPTRDVISDGSGHESMMRYI